MAWVRNRRVQTSLTLLRETRLSVQRIAGLTGFFDAAHLRRTVFAGTGRRVADLRVDGGFDAEISDRDGAAFLHVDPDQ